MTDFTFRQEDVVTCISIGVPVLFFTIYWFCSVSAGVSRYFYSHFMGDKGRVVHVLFLKYVGFVLLGVLPLTLFHFILPAYSMSDYGLTFSKGTNAAALKWIGFLGTLAIVINWFAARREKTRKVYPQIRIKEWTYSIFGWYLLGWIFYLLGYEIFFRALLFFPLVDTLGVWPAIAINVALYSTTHIPKGWDETMGAMVLGLILCILTLQTQTIWVAFSVHVVLALSNSIFAIYFNPEMKLVKSKSEKNV